MRPVGWASCLAARAGSAGSVAVGCMFADDLARAVPLVVAEAEDVDVVRRRRRLDLERIGLAAC